MPRGVVQYLPGPGGEVGQALVEHPGVDNVAFTGSSGVGLGIIATAAKTKPEQRNVKRVIAEMYRGRGIASGSRTSASTSATRGSGTTT